MNTDFNECSTKYKISAFLIYKILIFQLHSPIPFKFYLKSSSLQGYSEQHLVRTSTKHLI